MKRQIIINLYKYVEELYRSSTLPDEVSPNTAIYYYTNYLYMNGKELSEIKQLVTEKMNNYHFRGSQYQEYLAVDRITKYYRDINNEKLKPLRKIDTVPIYKSEYERIMQCETDRERKVLFTLYILARLNDNYGWVYQRRTDIYELANTSHSGKRQDNVFYLLYKNNHIKRTNKVDDLKIGVELSDGNEEVAFEVDEIKDLGKKFMIFAYKEYIMCEECGKLVKTTNKIGRRTKYCKKCSEIVNRNKTKERIKNKREIVNV